VLNGGEHVGGELTGGRHEAGGRQGRTPVRSMAPDREPYSDQSGTGGQRPQMASPAGCGRGAGRRIVARARPVSRAL
jgi:hypothetical protein